ncbi:MAG: ribonuclease P protein component [Pseudomonadota bacterium]
MSASGSHSTPRNGRPWQTLTNRADFLDARNGVRVHASAFVVQCLDRSLDRSLGRRGPQSAASFAPSSCRVGFTVTKKVGNAVTRNRIKRRLRAACDALEASRFPSDCDCVLIARPSAVDMPFERLVSSLDESLIKAARLHVAKRTGSGQNP